MNHYIHQWDPVAFQLWGIWFHWYWLAYLAGFMGVFYGGQRLIAWGHGRISSTHFVGLCWVGWVALFVGARLFYILVYYPDYYLQHPSEILAFWAGGMSFHGALLGIVLASWGATRWLKISLFDFTDLLALLVPMGLFLGRIGNFINGELVGRVSQVSLGHGFLSPL